MRTTLTLIFLFISICLFAQTGDELFNRAKKSKNTAEQVNLYIASGDAFSADSDYSSALKSYQRAEKKLKDTKDNLLIVQLKIKIGDVFTAQKKHEKAIDYLLEAKPVAYKQGYQEELITIYEQLAINYEALGDNVKAGEYTNLLNSLAIF